MLAVLIAGAAAALTIALIAASGSSAPSIPAQPGKAALTRQLESVNGARFGVARPASSAQAVQTPQQQLQAVAGARYGLHPTLTK